MGKSKNKKHLAGLWERIDATKMKKAFSKLPEEPDNVMMMGWEFESGFTPGHSAVEMVEKIANSEMGDHVFFYGDCGFEMPSIPASLGYHKAILEKHFFGNDFDKAFATRNGVGMHVHVDKKNFNAISIKKFLTFINLPENKDFIGAIGGRSLDRYRGGTLNFEIHRFADKRVKGTDLQFASLSQRKHLQVSSKSKYSGIDDIIGRGSPVSTSHAINSSKSTVEVRFMQSSPIMPIWFSRLEFIEASIIFSRLNVYKKLYAFEFCQFVMNNKERYPYLYAHPTVQNMLIRTSDEFFGTRMKRVTEQNLLTKGA